MINANDDSDSNTEHQTGDNVLNIDDDLQITKQDLINSSDIEKTTESVYDSETQISQSSYLASISEGFADEEIAETYPSKEETEIYFASPLKDFYSHTYLLPLDENLSADSDSDENISPLFSDSSAEDSSDSEYTSLIASSEKDIFSPKLGNIPRFDKIGTSPIVSIQKQTDKTLKTPDSNLSLKEKASFKSKMGFSPTSTESRPTFGGKGTEISEYLSSSPVEVFETGDVNIPAKDAFCSTDVQTKLLVKLRRKSESSSASEDSITFVKPKHTSPRRKHIRTATITSVDVSEDDYTDKTYSDKSNEFKDTGEAFEESMRKGSVTPLVKHELKLKIQVDRLSRGQTEMVLEPEQPKVYPLRPDEVTKKQRRLQQNRVSASKSRKKARLHERNLKQTIKKFMTENAQLTQEIEMLKKQRDRILAILDDHTTCNVSKHSK